MKPTVYTVHAYRWGDRECHSYSVGVYFRKRTALKAAQTESDYRGGKYECEVLEWMLDSGYDTKPNTVLALPQMNTLKAAGRGVTRNDSCIWTQDSDGTWNTCCGKVWEFNDGGPEENEAHFCHHCGGVLLAEHFSSEDRSAAARPGQDHRRPAGA